ncbi:MAG: prolyl oligopeptidase family serine peptidase [Elusimicrobiota bacterium]
MPWIPGLFLAAGLTVHAGPPAALSEPAAAFAAQVREVRRQPGFIEYEVRFPSALKSRFPANDTVWAHFSVPVGAKGPVPCIVVLPVMAAPNIWIEQRFINRFRKDGFAVLWLEMPYQFHRRPDPSMPSGQVFLARTAPKLAANFRQSVLDARRALTWLSKHPAVDPGRIGLFGTSLGGMVGSVVYSVDPRPRYAVFLLAGADFPSLAQSSSMTRPFMRRAGIDAESLRRAWRGIDPLDYMESNKTKKALLINCLWDLVIPKANALKLFEAFPAARQVWLPLGHYSAILHLLWIPRYISADFIEALK